MSPEMGTGERTQALKVGSAVFGPEQSRKIRQPVASQLETSPQKGPRRQEVKPADGQSPEDIPMGQQSQLGRVTWRHGKREPALEVNVFACPVHNSKQPSLGFWRRCVIFAIFFSPKRRHEGEAPGRMRLPRWDTPHTHTRGGTG